MSRFETIGPELDLEQLARHNRNLDRADTDLASLQQQVSTEQQERMAADAAHAGSTAAHPAENITYSGAVSGASNVKQAIDAQDARINTIVGSAGSSNTEIVDARPGADGVSHPVLKDRLDRMERRQLEDQVQQKTLARGANIITTTQASGATFKVRGCTLCNILGRLGNGESLTGWTAAGAGSTSVSTTQKASGLSSFRFEAIGSQNPTRYVDMTYLLEPTKYWLLVFKVFIESRVGGTPRVVLCDYGSNSGKYAVDSNVNIVGSWQTVAYKIPVANTLTGGFRLFMGMSAGATDLVAYFDEIRIYELSASDYASIGTTILGAEAIDRRWPYVDSVQHLQGVSVLMSGKNLYEGKITGTSGGSNYSLPNPNTIDVTSGANLSSYVVSMRVKVSPNTVYTLSFTGEIVTGADQPLIRVRKGSDSSGIVQQSGTGLRQVSFNTGIETEILLYVYGSQDTAAVQTKRYSDIQIEIGAVATSFELYNPQYSHAPVKLVSNVDRTIVDSYNSATGQVFRRWVVGFKLDGSLTWTGNNTNPTNYAIFTTLLGARLGDHVLVDYDGRYYKVFDPNVSLANAPDFVSRLNAVQALAITIPNSISGWIASVMPNNNAMKAIMNGWRANGNNGTVYNSWVSILSGAAPPTNTEAYVAANKAPGWDAYATLDYVRGTPITEDVTGDLGGPSVVKGGNAVELLEGVVVRERITPKQHGTTREWFINESGLSPSVDDTPLKYRTNNIVAIYRGANKDPLWALITNTSNQNGSMFGRIQEVDYDPAAEYSVDYIVLDKYAYTPNAVDATFVYQSTIGGAVAQNVQDIAAIKTQDGIQDWILAQYAARLLALEEA